MDDSTENRANGRDPGWKPAVRTVWAGFVPQVAARSRRTPMLTILRGMWLGVFLQWGLYGLLLTFPTVEDRRSALAFGLVLAGGTFSAGMAAALKRKLVQVHMEELLPIAYFRSSLVCWALTMAALLDGVLGFFLGGGFLAYVLSLPFVIVCFQLMAPIRANLERIGGQALVEGLSYPPPQVRKP